MPIKAKRTSTGYSCGSSCPELRGSADNATGWLCGRTLRMTIPDVAPCAVATGILLEQRAEARGVVEILLTAGHGQMGAKVEQALQRLRAMLKEEVS